MEVTNREVIYKSNIYFTPLTRDDEIDSEQVAYIISMEYENAGMTPDMLGSGAVIITGESAKKRNARMVTESIAELRQRVRIWKVCCQAKDQEQH